MSPKPSKTNPEVVRDGRWLSHAPPGEEVCITGLSGTFPESVNVHELQYNLMNKIDMVTPGFRKPCNHPLLPERCGMIKDADTFDAGFFGVPSKQADSMAINLKKLLELTFSAIVDAGINPRELRGTRTGVYLGASYVESEGHFMFEELLPNGWMLTSVSAAVWPQRIAHWLGITGPCYVVDTACSSSMYALDHAYQDIRDGKIDQAIVGGANLLLNPTLTVNFSIMGLMSPEGACKTFDNEANGYVRSEAVVVSLLQKAKDAKRIYSTIVHTKSNNDGFKEQGITFPSGPIQTKVIKKVYEECQIDPTDIEWLEAHGTGTRVGDPEELESIVSVFCKNRKTPLPIASIKTNLGHTENASGLCSIAKVIIAMETGLIPPVLHYKTPREGIPALTDGTLKIITDVTPWKGGLVGISSFGFGGGNSHLLLRSHSKEKVNGGAPRDSLPRLVTVSGRTVESVQKLLDSLESGPTDVEHVRLLHDVFTLKVEGHFYRGFTMLQPGKHVSEIQYCPRSSRQIWLTLSDQSCQWTSLASSLLSLPGFSEVIKICNEALKTKNLHIYDMIQSNTIASWEELYVIRTAAQIGLIEVLRLVGVYPHGIIAHPTSKMASSYASGICNMHQAFLDAYHEGRTLTNDGSPFSNLLQTSNYHGDDSSKYNGYDSFKMCEEDDVASYWASSVVSETIQKDNICTKDLLEKTVMQQMSPKMVASQVPQHSILIETTFGKFTDELCSLRKGISKVTLVDNGINNLEHLLTSLGKLYLCGVDLNLARLYPAVEFPVSRGTPMISPMIGWNHDIKWRVLGNHAYQDANLHEEQVEINLNLVDMQFFAGHVIDGRILFPATGYLVAVWELLAKINRIPLEQTPILFEDVRFLRATPLRTDGLVVLILIIQKITGRFEVVEKDEVVVTGVVSRPNNTAKQMLDLPPPNIIPGQIEMSRKDIYKELRLRGYNYSGLFTSIISSDITGRRSKVKWQNNWVAFMDNLLQTMIFSEDTRGLFVPTAIDRLFVDPQKHLALVEAMEQQQQEPVLDVFSYPEIKVIQGGGVEIHEISVSAIMRRKVLREPVLEKHVFVENTGASRPLDEALRICVHVGMENQLGINIKVAELIDDASDPKKKPLSPLVSQFLGELPLIQADITVLTSADDSLALDLSPEIKVRGVSLSSMEDCVFVIGSNVLARPEVISSFNACTKGKGFLISRERSFSDSCDTEGLEVLNAYTVEDETIVLARKKVDLMPPAVIEVTNSKYNWIPDIQAALKGEGRNVLLVSQGEELTGIMGLANCLRREPGGNCVRCVVILDPTAPKFDPAIPLYSKQLSKDLVLNIYKAGKWGSYRHLPLESNPRIDCGHAFLNTVTRGELSSLRWIQGPIDANSLELNEDEALYEIYYASLNFRDIMISSGKLAVEGVVKERLKQECVIGLEFVGRDLNGERVMGMFGTRCLSNLAIANKQCMWKIPDEWSMEDAATAPVVYCTVFMALRKAGIELKKGLSLLIHAGSGGVGQAAIHLALLAGCTVFTTVGSQEKRAFIKENFPQLTDRNIGNSRNTSFEQLIMEETNGRGVDVVLNSLAGDLLKASIRCLAVKGVFLEIGKVDIVSNTLIDMDNFNKQISFHGIFLDYCENDFELGGHADELRKYLEAGKLRPLRKTTFKAEEAEQAFRYMASGKHIGKVLIKIRDEEEVKNTIPKPIRMQALPRFACDPNRAYVIAGGLGGFGLELADWLILRGAKILVLTSRTGVKTGYQCSRINRWKSYGVNVHISTADITTEVGVKQLLNDANNAAPVVAIFNLAVVLQDAIFENQTEEQFVRSLGPKAQATEHLDWLSRKMCPQLKQFVVFSSVSCGRGNAGQTNYGMANSVMERICERRVADGLPGLAVQWGAVGDVGLLADKMEEHRELVIGGTLQQGISSCLHVLDNFLNQPHPVVASMVVAEKKAGLSVNLVEDIANMLGVRDVKTVSEHATLSELGADSLLVVEIKQVLEQDYDITLTPREIRAMTFQTLAKLVQRDGASDVVPEKAYNWDIGAYHLLVKAFASQDVAAMPLVTLPSLESAVHLPTLYMIPGFEGMASVFDDLSSQLIMNVKGIQLINTESVCKETVQDITEDIFELLKKNLSREEPFRILGYSVGGVILLQLVAQLEREGYTGQVYLLDSSPEFMKNVIYKSLNKEWDSSLTPNDNVQINLFLTMLSYVKAGEPVAYFVQKQMEMRSMKSCDARTEFFVSLLPDTEKYGYDYSISTVNSMWNRVKVVYNFNVENITKIKSPVTLFRPHYKGLKIAEDFGLSKYCERPVVVHQIEGDHVSIIQSPDIASILNNDVAILKKSSNVIPMRCKRA